MIRIMPRVRHYKTTARHIDGVTYRTTQSRGWIGGRYATPEDKRAGHAAAIAVIVLGWPWCITEIPMSAREAIAFAWYGLLVFGAKMGAKRNRVTKR